MGLLTKEDETMILSPLPRDLTRDAVVKALHDHYLITRLNDEIKDKDNDIKLLSGSPDKVATYHCDDTKPGSGYDIQISNRTEGSDMETHAFLPLGQKLNINTTMKVVQNGYGWNLVETVKLKGPRPVVAMAKEKIDGLHPKWHQKIFIRAVQLA